MDYALIALDLDGTALTSENTVTDVTRRAVAWARARGVQVAVSTGRGVGEAAMFARQIGAHALCVATGGAVLAEGEQCIERVSLPPDLSARALALFECPEIQTVVYAGAEVFVTRRDAEAFGQQKTAGGYCTNEGFLSARRVVDSLAETVAQESIALDKLFARSHDLERLARARQALSALGGLHLTSSAPDNFEVLAPGADKGVRLAQLARRMGTDLSHTIAIGDSENDMEMLRAVGMPVAMGNAPVSVRRVCRMVTDTNDADGVASAIYALLRE